MSTPLKVLHVEGGKNLYGGARQVLYLLEGLHARGVENVLVAPEDSAILAAAAESGVAGIRPDPMGGDLDVGFVWRLRRIIEEEKPDVVHLHSRRGADLLGGLAGKWSRGDRPVVILSRRVDNPESPWLVGAKYRLYDRVVTISEAIRRVLLDQGVPEARVTCVHSAVEPPDAPDPEQLREDCRQLRAELGIPDPGVPLVGMMAQFIERKGHRLILDAWQAVQAENPGARLLLFGKGSLEEEIRGEAEARGFGSTVHFMGFREDLARLRPCLALVVHPATAEGLGVAVLEAAAAGLPVVGGRAGGIPEAIDHEVTGFLVDPREADSLAGAVNALLGAPGRASRMGEAAREKIRREFSVDQMVEGNLAVYREVLRDRD